MGITVQMRKHASWVLAAVLLLVDGLGHELLHAHAADAPVLAGLARGAELLPWVDDATSGATVVGWLLLRQAAVATEALEAGAEGKDKDFYTGKIAAASFFAKNVLPLLAGERAIAEATDNTLMDVPESAF